MFDKLSLSQDCQLTEEEDIQHTEHSDAGLSQNPPLGSGSHFILNFKKTLPTINNRTEIIFQHFRFHTEKIQTFPRVLCLFTFKVYKFI